MSASPFPRKPELVESTTVVHDAGEMETAVETMRVMSGATERRGRMAETELLRERTEAADWDGRGPERKPTAGKGRSWAMGRGGADGLSGDGWRVAVAEDGSEDE